MTLDIEQLIKDAELVQQSIDGRLGWSAELEAIDRILAYFRARYTPPSEPGSYRDARGALEAMNDLIRRHNKPAL